MTVEPMPEQLRLQGWGCRHLGSPFYGDLLDLAADDFEAGGPVATLLAPHEGKGPGRGLSRGPGAPARGRSVRRRVA
jgi:hypothetical protein